IIMAQPQRPADVHQDELCPPNKRYALMDASKKIDLDNPLYPNESKIMANVIQNHPLRFSIAASSSLRSPSNFKTTGLVQPWQTLRKIFARYYAELLWERLHYVLKNLSTSIPYPRFTKLIVRHYMSTFPEISHRARDKYYNLEDDVMVKNIFNFGKHKDGVGIKIPSSMITNEMKLTDDMKLTYHYRMYVVVFGVDVPTTQSQLIDYIQGTHRTTSAPRRSERVTPPIPIPTTDEADDLVLQDTLQVGLVEQKSHEELEAKLEPRSDKESPEVKLTTVEQLVNVNEDKEESAEDDYELKRREKGKHVEESRSTPSPTTN
ncbi:hypothetical protein Tco_0992051, partial [Tanacetum coccineum]